MPWIPIAAAAAGSIGSGIIGASSAAADRDAARRAYEQSVKDYEAIGVPSVEAQRLVMQQYQSAGQWTPELEEAVKLGDSNMLGVSTDSGYTEAQKQALSRLQDIGASGGMTLTDQAQLERNLGNIAADTRGAREAILQNARSRGVSGSGMELAAQLMAQQEGANRAHQVGLDVNAQAQDRALQAIMQAGQLGGQLREQQFGERAQQAAAQDAINQWNAANQQAVRQNNANWLNQASQYNLGNQQRIMDANVGLKNEQEAHNKGLYQQQFNNRLNLAQGKGNARAGQASNLNQNAQNTANTWSRIGSGIAQAGVGAAQMMNNNEQRDLDRQAYGSNIGRLQTMGPVRASNDDELRYQTYS